MSQQLRCLCLQAFVSRTRLAVQRAEDLQPRTTADADDISAAASADISAAGAPLRPSNEAAIRRFGFPSH